MKDAHTIIQERIAIQLLINIVEGIFDHHPAQLDSKELEDYLEICKAFKIGSRVHEVQKYLDEN